MLSLITPTHGGDSLPLVPRPNNADLSHVAIILQVGLAGPSGAGKTAFAKKILNLVPGCAMLSMDNYNDGSKVIDGNFDDPRITDYDTLLANIQDLKEGRSTQAPIYDFKESRRVGCQTVQVPESRVVILEGIYALNHKLRPMLDLRVSITGGVHFDLVKRVLRDIDRSGQAPEDIIQQVSDTVYPMYKAFIEPDLKAAHLRIVNTFNPFSGFMSPTYILKAAPPVCVTQEQIAKVLKPDHVIRSETETYDIYLVPPGEDPETCQSWLRMRYRDGRYSLMFEEWMVEGHFIISPRVTFEVPVRILGGLMALGYEIGTIMRRTSRSFADDELVVKLDDVHGMERTFVQVQGKDRAAVAETGFKLGLEGQYVPHSYIELVQLENLMQDFQEVTEDLKRRFAVNGEPLIDETVVGSFSRGSSPHFGSFIRTTGFAVTSPRSPVLPPLSTSAPVATKHSSAAIRGGLLSQRINEVAVSQPIPTSKGSRSSVSASSGGSDRAPTMSKRGSRPPSPDVAAVDVQLRRLVEGQTNLSNQVEELALAVSLSESQARKKAAEQQLLMRQFAVATAVTPGTWFAVGALAGCLASILLLKGLGARN